MDLHFELAADAFVAGDPFAVMISVQGRELLGRRYDYVAELLEQGFAERYNELFASSRLHYEVINLIGLCTATMNSFQFPRRVANKALKKAVTAIINDYFKDYGGNA
jgi:hypothetical protein